MIGEFVGEGWTLTVRSKHHLIVKITDEDRAPMVRTVSPDGEIGEERDWGNCDWPSDADIARETGKILGKKVSVRFFDGCDGRLDEALYTFEVEK